MSAADMLGLSDDVFLIRNRGFRCCDARVVGGVLGQFVLGNRTVTADEVRAFAARLRGRTAAGPQSRESEMVFRGKSVSAIVEDMQRVEKAHRGEMHALYGPTGGTLRPELIAAEAAPATKPKASAKRSREVLAEGVPDAPTTVPKPALVPTPDTAKVPAPVASPVCSDDAFGGMTVADLLRRMQIEAVHHENELDELVAGMSALRKVATRYAVEARV